MSTQVHYWQQFERADLFSTKAHQRPCDLLLGSVETRFFVLVHPTPSYIIDPNQVFKVLQQFSKPCINYENTADTSFVLHVGWNSSLKLPSAFPAQMCATYMAKSTRFAYGPCMLAPHQINVNAIFSAVTCRLGFHFHPPRLVCSIGKPRVC
jgi:hypothetical protein